MNEFAYSLALFLVTLPIHLLNAFGYSKLFQKAGRPGWTAFIPFLNSITVMEITGRKKTDFFLELIPVVNVFIYIRDIIELLRCFGEERTWHKTIAIVWSWIYLPVFALKKSSVYRGSIHALPQQENPKSIIREWIDAIGFALIVAAMIRWLIMGPYTIPTPSMEGSLLAGDFLFVSKFHYGARTTTTPLQVPFTHQKIWYSEVPSYLDWITLPQYRLPGIAEVKRNDVVVFNVPPMELNDNKNYPIELKTNYIKRCVAIPGDTLQIIDLQVYINGKPGYNPPGLQYSYIVSCYHDIHESVFGQFGIYDYEVISRPGNGVIYQMYMTPDLAEEVRKLKFTKDVTISTYNGDHGFGRRTAQTIEPSIFPESEKFRWNSDFFGPLVIPVKGMTITIDEASLAIYGHAIQYYEQNQHVSIENGKLFIDGQELTRYTFKQNYYFMMGDNRHNSLDSRYWGFVPEDHIVGKAFFIWLSIDNNANAFEKIRWKRFFKIVE